MSPLERQAERAMHRINEATNRIAAECQEFDTGPESGMQMLAYLLIAVVVTAGAILISFFITR